jgi:hypothetical protein
MPTAEPTAAPTTEATTTTKATTSDEPTSAPAAATLANGNKTPAKTEKEEEEPQNYLTKKFTEAEWKALKEFRVRSPPFLPFCRLAAEMVNTGLNRRKYHQYSLMLIRIVKTPSLQPFYCGASQSIRTGSKML